jgi:hypothetical protein
MVRALQHKVLVLRFVPFNPEKSVNTEHCCSAQPPSVLLS